VSTDPGIWGWTSDIGQLGFTVTFSLGLSPEEVLQAYGADATQARSLSRLDAWNAYPPSVGRSQLRAGTIGRWGFCFEEAGTEGIKPATLTRLSADTETISFYTAAGTSRFIYLKDGQGVEAFEPGRPETLHGNLPRRFWDNTIKILERAGHPSSMPPQHAVLQAIVKHVRGLLDRSVLEGPLLTGILTTGGAGTANPHFDDQAARPATPRPVPQPSPHRPAAQQAAPQPVPQPSPHRPAAQQAAAPVTDYSMPRRPAPEFEPAPDYSAPLSAASLQMLQELQAHMPPVRTRRGTTPASGFDRVEDARAS